MNSRLSIRVRVASGAAGLAGAVIVLFAFAVYAHMRAELFEEVDLELRDFGARVAGDPEAWRGAGNPFHPRIHVVTARLAETGATKAPSWEDAVPAPLADMANGEVLTWRTELDAWRVLSAGSVGGRRLVAYDLEEVDDVLSELVLVCLVGGGILISAASVVGWWWSGRVLGPVRELTRAAEAIDAEGLHRRVPLPAADDELRRLGEVLNAMLERIEAGFLQARRFTADASHELRTPLTIMRGELDRLLREKEVSPAFESRLLRVQESTARLQRLTESLLMLARLDASVEGGLAMADLDFSLLVGEACEDGALLAEVRAVALEVNLAAGIRVRGNAEGLRRVVLNLLDNATRYNRPDGRVWCRLAVEADGVCLRVANTGPGIEESVRGRLFQRFMRGDDARTSGGHGLGLALSHEIARAHGGELRLSEPSRADYTEFVLLLPCAGLPGAAGQSRFSLVS